MDKESACHLQFLKYGESLQIITTVTFVWWTLHTIKVLNLGDVSKEHGERFNHDIHIMERMCQGCWDCAMMGYYVWGISTCRELKSK